MPPDQVAREQLAIRRHRKQLREQSLAVRRRRGGGQAREAPRRPHGAGHAEPPLLQLDGPGRGGGGESSKAAGQAEGADAKLEAAEGGEGEAKAGGHEEEGGLGPRGDELDPRGDGLGESEAAASARALLDAGLGGGAGLAATASGGSGSGSGGGGGGGGGGGSAELQALLLRDTVDHWRFFDTLEHFLQVAEPSPHPRALAALTPERFLQVPELVAEQVLCRVPRLVAGWLVECFYELDGAVVRELLAVKRLAGGTGSTAARRGALDDVAAAAGVPLKVGRRRTPVSCARLKFHAIVHRASRWFQWNEH